MKKLVVLSVLLIIVLASCFSSKDKTVASEVMRLYENEIVSLDEQINTFISEINKQSSSKSLQDKFKQTRLLYKRIEWLVEYYSPFTAKQINGPALAEVEPDAKNIIIQPEGFQVIEQLLFPSYEVSDNKELLAQTQLLQSNIQRLRFLLSNMQLTDAHVFDALRLELFRIITLGISGFDSPIANHSIPEALSALAGLKNAFFLFQFRLAEKNPGLLVDLDKLFLTSGKFLSLAPDFNSFDRMVFINSYGNPLSEKLLLAQRSLGIPVFSETRALRPDAKTLFSENVFDVNFYASSEDAYYTPAKQQLGKKLFYDASLSSNGTRSCASCHQPSKAFADGLAANFVLNQRKQLKRNTPTLLNAALQPALFYDTRVSYLEDQAKEVINNKDEMHGSLQTAVAYVKKNKSYSKLLQDAFGNKAVSEVMIKNAVASYVRSLIALNSRFDQYMRGNMKALTRTEIKGFNIFMGKARCGTCHFLPLFNGVNPPQFAKVDAEVIGVPSAHSSKQLDEDEGKYSLYKISLHKHAFKTPTIRNIALTAPYMHNGVYKTLEEVIDFYDHGGGAGLGLKIDNQTLASDSLHLDAYEKQALIQFMQALTDTTIKN